MKDDCPLDWRASTSACIITAPATAASVPVAIDTRPDNELMFESISFAPTPTTEQVPSATPRKTSSLLKLRTSWRSPRSEDAWPSAWSIWSLARTALQPWERVYNTVVCTVRRMLLKRCLSEACYCNMNGRTNPVAERLAHSITETRYNSLASCKVARADSWKRTSLLKSAAISPTRRRNAPLRMRRTASIWYRLTSERGTAEI